MHVRRDILLLVIALTAPHRAGAQTADERRLEARLAALDQMTLTFPTPEASARFAARFAAGDLLAPVAGTLAEQVRQDVWPTALAEIERLLNDAGDELVRMPQRSPAILSTSSVPVRRLMDERLRLFPPSVGAAYREELDAAARKLISEWRATSSPVPLRRVVRELAFSTLAEEAADTLGDLAFEQGDFDTALAWWHAFPADGPSERARRRQARRLLAGIFLNRFAQVRRDLDDWRRADPGAAGTLAGRSGAYVETLEHWLQTRHARGQEDAARAWPTFAGASTRNGVLAVAPSPRLWHEADRWQVPLSVTKGAAAARGGGFGRASLMPIILAGQVLISDGRRVTSYDLATGELRFRYAQPGDAGSATRGNVPSLSAAAGRVYSVLHQDTLVCLDAAPADAPREGKLLWQAKAQAPQDHPATFTSDALVAQDRLFIVVSRTFGARTQHFVACYTARRGIRQWLEPLHEGPAWDAHGASIARLLTWAGDRLVYATHQGEVLALDPWTGQRLWRVRYPAHHTFAMPRDPSPAVYYDGRILVAAGDARLLLCVEAATGRVLWELPGVEITHLLGVGDGMAVFTTRHGIEGVDVRTGGAERRWRQPDGGRIATPGRGLLAGSFVFWPTQDAELPWRVLSLSTGEPPSPGSAPEFAWDPSQFRTLPAGDLIFAAGSLVAVTADGMVVLPAPTLTRAGRE